MSLPKSSTPISGGVIFKGIMYSSFSSDNKFFASSKLIEKSVPGDPTFNSKGSLIKYAFCSSEYISS